MVRYMKTRCIKLCAGRMESRRNYEHDLTCFSGIYTDLVAVRLCRGFSIVLASQRIRVVSEQFMEAGQTVLHEEFPVEKSSYLGFSERTRC